MNSKPTKAQIEYWGSLKGKTAWNKNLKGEKYKKHFVNGMGGQFIKGIQNNKKSAFKKGHVSCHKGKYFTHYKSFKPGKEHWNWQGGKTLELYGLEFDHHLREVIRNRDRRKCQLCNKTELENEERLSVHHIDYNKLNNNTDNLISLCYKCHLKTNTHRKYWTDYFYKYEQ